MAVAKDRQQIKADKGYSAGRHGVVQKEWITRVRKRQMRGEDEGEWSGKKRREE